MSCSLPCEIRSYLSSLLGAQRRSKPAFEVAARKLDCFAPLAMTALKFLQRQFRLAAGVALGCGGCGRRRRAHKTPADRGGVAGILPDHDLGGAARAVVAGQEHAVFQLDLVVERLEGPDVAGRQADR